MEHAHAEKRGRRSIQQQKASAEAVCVAASKQQECLDNFVKELGSTAKAAASAAQASAQAVEAMERGVVAAEVRIRGDVAALLRDKADVDAVPHIGGLWR